MSDETCDHAANEPRADVYFVKVNDSQAGVIVAFYDAGEEDPVGIYLYEPGADPVELDTAGLDGVATEFEYATVTAAPSSARDTSNVHDGVPDTLEFPGDAMVTRAQRDADVEAATEEHATLVDDHEKLTEQARALVDAIRHVHNEWHPGAFQWCTRADCETARGVQL